MESPLFILLSNWTVEKLFPFVMSFYSHNMMNRREKVGKVYCIFTKKR